MSRKFKTFKQGDLVELLDGSLVEVSYQLHRNNNLVCLDSNGNELPSAIRVYDIKKHFLVEGLQ